MKKTMTCLLLASAIMLLSGCSTEKFVAPVSAPNQPESTVKVATLRGPSAVSLIPMLDTKPFLTKRVKTEYQIYNSPDLMIPDLVKGQIDAALLPPNLAAKLYNKGIDYQLVGVTCWGVMYLASDNQQLTGIDQLKGQKIYLTDKGATPDLVFNYLLQANGLQPTDVILDYSLGQTELAQSMAASRVKTGLLVEPWLTVVTTGNPAIKNVIDLQQEWQKATNNMPLPQTCLIVKKSLLTGNPEAVTSLCQQVKQSIEWVNDHPQEAGILVEKHGVGMKAAVATKAIPRLNLSFKAATTSRPALESFFKIIIKFDPTSTGGKLPDDGFYFQQ
ncbi:MAG: ABC transporter substrate-binding protein [Methylocystaceae bacterium]